MTGTSGPDAGRNLAGLDPSAGERADASETGGGIPGKPPAPASLPLPIATAIMEAPVGIAVFSPDRRLIFANVSFGTLLSIPAGQLAVGISFRALLDTMAATEDDVSLDSQAFLTACRAADHTCSWSARRMIDPDTVLDVACTPLPDGGSTITVMRMAAFTGTQGGFGRGSGPLDMILAEVPHGICVYGADGRVTMFNRAYAQIMAGAPLAVGDHITDVIRRLAESGEYGPGEPEATFAEQIGFDISCPRLRRRRRRDGTAIEIRTAPLPDGGHISVVTDITALLQAEDEVTRRAEQMTQMLANVRHGILLWDAERRLVASNTVAEDLLGGPGHRLRPGLSERDFLNGIRQREEWGTGAEADQLIQSIIERRDDVPYSRDVLTRSGRALEMRLMPAPNGGWVGTCSDVSDARLAEEALRRSRDSAEAANRAKSRFLATMSHELRTPLNAVIGFSDALLRQAYRPDPARAAEFAQQINTSGRQLLDLVNIILDVARIESGRFDLTADQVDIPRLIRAVVRQTDSAAQAAEIAVRTCVPGDLPRLRGDERRLAQAVSQLVSNAIKFSEANTEITIGAEVEGSGGLLIYVADSGIGIAEDNVERVFEPFMQVDNALGRRYPGAGLGLYIARSMIVAHEGSLTLQSRPSSGTRAEIRLPAGRLVAVEVVKPDLRPHSVED